MIRFTDVYMRYAGGKDALKNINLQVEKGEMVYLTGHSGAGKTTLLRLIALAERHSRGQIVVNGQNLARLSGRRIPLYRRNIGFMFQEHRLLNERSVFDNVALPLTIAGYRYQDIKKRTHTVLGKSRPAGERTGFTHCVIHGRTTARGHCPGCGASACLTAG